MASARSQRQLKRGPRSSRFLPLFLTIIVAIIMFSKSRVEESASQIRVENRWMSVAMESSGRGFVVLRTRSFGGPMQLEIEPVLLNGQPITDLRLTSAGAAVWTANKENSSRTNSEGKDLPSVHVKVEVLDDAAISITWTTYSPSNAEAAENVTAIPLEAQFEVKVRDPERSWYGGGERFNSVDQKGNVLSMESKDRPLEKKSYKPIPFIMSSAGYGVWVKSYARGTFSANAPSDSDYLVLRYRVSTLQVILIGGSKLLDVLSHFTALSGRPRVPPPWALAPWKGRDVHFSSSEVIEDAELTRKHKLPASVILIDSPWSRGYNDFVLNTDQFPNADQMFRRLEELGFHNIFWVTPFVNSLNRQDMRGIVAGPSENFAEADKDGHLVQDAQGGSQLVKWWKGKGGRVDFTSPAAVDFWHRGLNRTLQWRTTHGFKCDDGEGQYFEDGAIFKDGTPLSSMRTRYVETYMDAMDRFIQTYLKGDGVLMARSAFTGTARSFVWAGDQRSKWDAVAGLPTVIIAGQTAALSGLFLWGHDIGGYFGKTVDRDLFIRWTQLGALSPLMHQFGQANNGPWNYDDFTLKVYQRFARLHMSLFPYLMAAMVRAVEAGHPVICPMALCFEGDRVAAQRKWQYMFGPDLLVAPVYQQDNRSSVYFPNAVTWLDFWTGKKMPAATEITEEVPLDRMPIYIKEASLLELIPEDTDTLVPRTPAMSSAIKTLTSDRVLQVWPGPIGELTRTFSSFTASLQRTRHSENSLKARLVLSVTMPCKINLQVMFQDGVEDVSFQALSEEPTLMPCDPGLSLDRPANVCRLRVEAGQNVVTWVESVL